MKPKQTKPGTKTVPKSLNTSTTKPAGKHNVTQSQSNLKKEEKKETKHVKLDSQVKSSPHPVHQANKKSNTLSKSTSKEKLTTSSKENSKTISKENSSAKLVEKKEIKPSEIKKEDQKIISNSMFVPQSSQKENLTNATILTENSKDDILSNSSPDLQNNQIKKLNDERKELNHQISNLKRENADLKKKS